MTQVQIVVTQTQQPDGTVKTEVSGHHSGAISAYVLGAGLMVLNDNLVQEEQQRLSGEDGMPRVELWTPGDQAGPN